ncbi:P-loop containing nucleoside triphosphate hydrolase protein [Xylaria acuta]|nr:P-loop containing nucleoside triphosphate hydrolase protein [Xylaria acuta]
MTNPESPPLGRAVEPCPGYNDLLNAIGRLFPRGLEQSLDMLSMVVCGDQASGKSALLSTLFSTITGMPFPVNKSPSFPLIFKWALRRDKIASVSVEILPGSYRSEEERQALSAFHRCTRHVDIGNTIKEAEEIIRLNTTGKLLCGDVLYIEIAGPTQPHLTLVDLPGLFPAGSDGQFEDALCIEDTMLDYMKDQQTIILAVVSAEKDFALQRRFYSELARNNHAHFRLGWHVLCNRPYVTGIERDQIEADFLAGGVWRRLSPSRCGVTTLRARVGNILYDEVMDKLPGILKKTEVVMKEYEQRLLRLGSPRDTIHQQRQFLFRVSTAFTGVLKAAVDGRYIGPFFACSDTGGYSRRLRNVIQNILFDFAVKIRQGDQAQIIQDVEPLSSAEPRWTSRAQYMGQVEALMRKYRGCELPGTYNPLIVSELFSKQCRPWGGLISELRGTMMDSVETVVNKALHYVTDHDTAAGISRVIIGPYLQELGGALRSKLDELLEPHLLGHPITYNNFLTESVRNAQADRSRVNIEMHLQTFFGDLYKEGNRGIMFDMEALIDSLVTERELDLNAYPCNMVIDTADAYYKIALEKIIDDVSVLAIERCLIQKLPDLLAADIICHLTDSEVQSTASESSALVAERALVTEKLTVLKEGLAELGKFKKRLASSKPLNETSSNSSTENASFKTSDDVKSTDPDEAEAHASGVDNFWESIGYPFKGKKSTPKGENNPSSRGGSRL